MLKGTRKGHFSAALAEDVYKRQLQGQLKQAEDALLELNRGRGDLEREIQVKRKSLYIDKERCQIVRMQYPSSTALAGH